MGVRSGSEPRSGPTVSYAMATEPLSMTARVSALRRREMEIAEEHLVFPHERPLGSDRILDLHDHVGPLPDLFGVGRDFRTSLLVEIVGEAAVLAGTGLDQHPLPLPGQGLRTSWRKSDPVFALFDLGWNAYKHVSIPFGSSGPRHSA